MANSNNISVANKHVDYLIDYVLDTKPFRTKLAMVVEEYLFSDSMKVTIKDSLTVVDSLNPSGNLITYQKLEKPVEHVESTGLALPEKSKTKFSEGLKIVEKVNGEVESVSLFYDFSKPFLMVTDNAKEYVITHNGPAHTPTVVVESESSPGQVELPTPNLKPSKTNPNALSSKSFSFTVQSGITAPFKLTVS